MTAPEMYDSSLGPLSSLSGVSVQTTFPLTRTQGARLLALGSILQLLRPQTLEEQRAQRLYRTQVQQIAGRVRATFDDWVRMREVEPDNMRLANVAAVNRWELMRLANEAEQIEPPRKLNNIHRAVQEAVVASARACQLLANGYRFYKSEAVCDGQALLVDTVQELSDLEAQLRIRF
jgi:hypothetical protein